MRKGGGTGVGGGAKGAVANFGNGNGFGFGVCGFLSLAVGTRVSWDITTPWGWLETGRGGGEGDEHGAPGKEQHTGLLICCWKRAGRGQGGKIGR